MSQRTELATFRVPAGTTKRLKTLAHRLSLASGQEVSWAGILRQFVQHALDDEAGTAPHHIPDCPLPQRENQA